MYIDLDKICKDFIDGKTEINDIIKKYNINYFKLVKYIKKYCFGNGILMNEEITRRLEIPIKEMIDLRKQGISYKKLAERYGYSNLGVRQILIKYCEQNNLEIPKANKGPRKKNLPMEKIYKLKKQEMTYKEIAEIYDCGIMTIIRRLKEYEEELVLRNRFLEILLQDFTGIKDDILNKTIGSFYDDKENKKQDDYSFIKR